MRVSPASPAVDRTARLHVVTGKGGTGKTTVAAALALALAADGRSVLLIETEGRQGIAQLFDTPPLPYEERRVAVARGGGEVKALAIDTEEALLEYLDMFYNLRRAGRALRKMGAIDFATSIAPGVRDVLLTGKIKEAVTRRHDGRPVYDAVVVDAPADRPDHPLPRRDRPRWRQLAKVRPDQDPERRRHGGAALAADRGAPGHPARGHAGAGDGRRDRRADEAGTCRSARSIVNMAAEPCCPPASLDRAAEGRLTGADLAPALGAAHLTDRRRSPTRSPRRPSSTPAAVGRAGRAARRRSTALGRPVVELPQLIPGRSTSAACSSSPAASRSTSRRRWRRMTAPRQAQPLDLAALLADRDTRIIVCCGAGGVGKTTTSAALALARGRAPAATSSS